MTKSEKSRLAKKKRWKCLLSPSQGWVSMHHPNAAEPKKSSGGIPWVPKGPRQPINDHLDSFLVTLDDDNDNAQYIFREMKKTGIAVQLVRVALRQHLRQIEHSYSCVPVKLQSGWRHESHFPFLVPRMPITYSAPCCTPLVLRASYDSTSQLESCYTACETWGRR